MVSQETIDEIDKQIELNHFEKFKAELVDLCKRFSYKLEGSGDYGITITTLDGKDVLEYIDDITPNGIKTFR